MKMPWNDLEGPARILAICATVLLVSGGLCGLQAVLMSAIHNNSLITFFMVTGLVELGAIVLSLVVGLGAVVAWVGTAVFSGSREDGAQKLFENGKDEDDSNP